MSAGFTRSLEAVLARTDASSPPAKATVRPQDAAERSRKWFAKFAEKRVMPLLAEAAQAAEKYGVTATSRLHETEGRLTRGAVVVDWLGSGGGKANARIAMEVDRPRFEAMVATALGVP